MNAIIFVFALFFLLFPLSVFAHCPLCTAGAAAAAGGASLLGVKHVVIGLFIGAFAVSTGLWFSNALKKKFIPFQAELLALFSFFATVLPLGVFFQEIHPFYISLAGDYGSLLNSTYVFDVFFLGSAIGGAIIYVAPFASSKLTEFNSGKHIAFQGIIVSFGLLFFLALILQFLF